MDRDLPPAQLRPAAGAGRGTGQGAPVSGKYRRALDQPAASGPLPALPPRAAPRRYRRTRSAAAAAGAIAALALSVVLFRKADLTMALNGALAGLVAITAEPSTPTALQATLFGAIGGVLVVASIIGLDKLKIDDPVGAISVHGTVGIYGLLLVPLTNSDSTFLGQLVGGATIFAWVFGCSLIVWYVLKLVVGIRVSEEAEYEGVDASECGIEAYPEFVASVK